MSCHPLRRGLLLEPPRLQIVVHYSRHETTDNCKNMQRRKGVRLSVLQHPSLSSPSGVTHQIRQFLSSRASAPSLTSVCTPSAKVTSINSSGMRQIRAPSVEMDCLTSTSRKQVVFHRHTKLSMNIGLCTCIHSTKALKSLGLPLKLP